MSAGFCSWLAQVKSDDNEVDAGLANDFEGSLAGLGVDVGSTTYNMRDTDQNIEQQAHKFVKKVHKGLYGCCGEVFSSMNIREALLALPAVLKQQAATRSKVVTGFDKPQNTAAINIVNPITTTVDFSQLGFSIPNRGTLSKAGLDGGANNMSQPIATSAGMLGGASYHKVSLADLANAAGQAMPEIHVAADQLSPEWVTLMTSMNLSSEITEETNEGRFQYILCAPTSPATRLTEETLTYLNQGQSYEIKLKRLKHGSSPNELLLRSVVRVVFHERRLQYMEREQLDLWKLTRPGERIVDIDIPQSNLLVDVRITPHRLNCVEFVWDPSRDTSLYIKVHCISTEFTAKKHGGEKGVPFRIRVETYAYSSEADGMGAQGSPGGQDGDNTSPQPELLHCASCQVKVFKPKGADRKLKTDREKIDRFGSDMERNKYQPSYDCTVLIEIPVDQVRKYLELLHKQQDEDEKKSTGLTIPTAGKSPSLDSPTWGNPGSGNSSSGNSGLENSSLENFEFSQGDSLLPIKPMVKGRHASGNMAVTSASSSGNSGSKGMSRSTSLNFNMVHLSGNPLVTSRKRPSETCLTFSSGAQRLMTIKSSNVEEAGLSPMASSDEVTQWLTANRFSAFISVFKNFSGSDLLRLQKEDLTQICGLAGGIRLYNSLQSKSLKPKLTLYVCQSTDIEGLTTPVNQAATDLDHASSNGSTASRHSTPSPTTFSHSPDPATFNSNCNTSAMQSWVNAQQQQVWQGQQWQQAVQLKGQQGQQIQGQIQGQGQIQPGQMIQQNQNWQQQQQQLGQRQQQMQNWNMLEQQQKSQQLKSLQQQLNQSNSSWATSGVGGVAWKQQLNSNGQQWSQQSNQPISTQQYTSASSVTTEPSRLSHGSMSAKRHMMRQGSLMDEDDDVFGGGEVSESANKKQKMLDQWQQEVYHALYLEILTERHLCDKLSNLYSLDSSHVLDLLVHERVGIHVLITDQVVQNFKDQTRYSVKAIQDEERPGYYHILLNSSEL